MTIVSELNFWVIKSIDPTARVQGSQVENLEIQWDKRASFSSGTNGYEDLAIKPWKHLYQLNDSFLREAIKVSPALVMRLT